MMRLHEERRAQPRVDLHRPCKVYEPRLGRYFPATTSNLSAGGMAIDLPRCLPLQPGDELLVGVAQKRRQMLLRTHEMIRVRVARAITAPDGTTRLGVTLLDEDVADDTCLRQAA